MSRIIGKYNTGCITAGELAVLFNLPGVSQFPPEGLPPIAVQGHVVWVDPKHPTKPMSIRTMTRCLDCGKVIQVGRLAQHDRIVHQGIKPRNQNRDRVTITRLPGKTTKTVAVTDDQGRTGIVTGPRCSFCIKHGVANCRHIGM